MSRKLTGLPALLLALCMLMLTAPRRFSLGRARAGYRHGYRS